MTTGAARGEPRGTTFVRVGGDGVTVGQRQELMRNLAPQAPVRLRISADLRLNVLIGDLPVHAAYAHPGSAGAALVRRVHGRS